MGSWIEDLRKMRKPNHITIEAYEYGKLKVTLQYSRKKLYGRKIDVLGTYTKVVYVNEVGIDLRNLAALVQKGEKWGDWGGPIKVGNVIHIEEKKITDPVAELMKQGKC